MRCVTPMFRRYEVGNYKKGKIVSRKEVLENLSYDPNYINFCLTKMNKRIGAKYKYEQIRCGHCWACRLQYSAEWATRLTYECQKSEHNYFVTLTYDNSYLPIADKIKLGDQIYKNNGDKVWQEGTVWEEHMKKFIHDLRQYLDRKYPPQYDENGLKINGMKYFYCAEYGEQTHRPHYHIILMNCPLDLSQFYDTHIDERYKAHWKSKEIEKYWKYGMIDIAEAEWSSCAYVARYCMKKLHEKNNEEYAQEGKLPEFIRMSKGIGLNYFNEHKKKIYNSDEVIMKTVQGNTGAFKPPKAWDRKYQQEFPEEWELIKQSRQAAAERSRQLERELSDYTDLHRLDINADLVAKKGKMLPRVGEW